MSRKIKDISGQKFGRLTVVSLLPRSDWKGRSATWLCKCDCGQECIVDSGNLRSGNIKSCGCLRKELARDKRESIDLSGRSFGRLTVLYRLDEPMFRGRGKVYRCICECGQECNVPAHSLLTGNTKSCGCGNGYGHRRKKIFNELTGQFSSKSDTVIFLDGNPANLTKDNLMSVSRKVYHQAWRDGLLTSNQQLTKTALLAYELDCKVTEAIRNKR